MKIYSSSIKSILMITLSNIGDVVLTLPVLGVLKREFPGSAITVMVGPNGRDIFEADPSISEVVVYDKHVTFSQKLRLGLRLRRKRFDLVIDLRSSIFPLLAGARYNSPLFKKGGASGHRRDKHLRQLSALGISTEKAPFQMALSRDDKLHISAVLNRLGILTDDNMIAVAPGAKSHIKRWTVSGFTALCARITQEMGYSVILVGDKNDGPINNQIMASGIKGLYDLSGKTSIRELACLISLCKALVTNDSAPLHIASAFNVPTVAIFGPTDESKYGPLSERSRVIRARRDCAPCETALCRFDLECMKGVPADEVFGALKGFFT